MSPHVNTRSCHGRRSFIGGSDTRTIMGDDEAALVRLWREEHRGGYLRLRDFRKRTPSPPPFSSVNSMPAASIARCSLARASFETRGPNPPSSRLTVGRDSPARPASSD
jgi:hypothetical protein